MADCTGNEEIGATEYRTCGANPPDEEHDGEQYKSRSLIARPGRKKSKTSVRKKTATTDAPRNRSRMGSSFMVQLIGFSDGLDGWFAQSRRYIVQTTATSAKATPSAFGTTPPPSPNLQPKTT
ncbi:hypothetical protein [Halospeciosus flavus]|uniref:hypothetical protein n=1 Tax=Halospeciosus flavus TaxID=3032283 RepID=UPI003607C13D